MAAHWATMSDRTTPYTVVPFNPLRFEEHEFEHSHPPHSVVGADADAPAAPFSLVVDSEKEFIRTRILGRSNEDIVKDPDPAVMAELRSLGSDLNINAFVCNFRFRSRSKGKKKKDLNVNFKEGITGEAKQRSGAADPDAHIDETGREEEGEEDGDEDEEWVVNDDVAEANYLNRCIFDRLSLTDLGQNPRTTPMLLSSTILKHEEYRECLKHFKQRVGLETESKQDLFVLRNVVMSPFQASADFVANIADTFRNVLEDSLKVRSLPS